MTANERRALEVLLDQHHRIAHPGKPGDVGYCPTCRRPAAATGTGTWTHRLGREADPRSVRRWLDEHGRTLPDLAA